MRDHRGQLPPNRCQPLAGPASTGRRGRPDQTERPRSPQAGEHPVNHQVAGATARAPRTRVRLAAHALSGPPRAPATIRRKARQPELNHKTAYPEPARAPCPLPPGMIRSPAVASRAPAAPLCGRCAPVTRTARSQKPGSYQGTGSRLKHVPKPHCGPRPMQVRRLCVWLWPPVSSRCGPCPGGRLGRPPDSRSPSRVGMVISGAGDTRLDRHAEPSGEHSGRRPSRRCRHARGRRPAPRAVRHGSPRGATGGVAI